MRAYQGRVMMRGLCCSWHAGAFTELDNICCCQFPLREFVQPPSSWPSARVEGRVGAAVDEACPVDPAELLDCLGMF